MRVRSIIAALAVASGLAVPAAAAADVVDRGPVRVAGQVATPASYDRAALEAQPQVTVTGRAGDDANPAQYRGPSVAALVEAAAPALPPAPARNGTLRVTIQVGDTSGRTVTLAGGELLATFGQRTAVLALTRDGVPLPAPLLVVGGDRSAARSLAEVSRLDVGVQSPAGTTPPSAGAVTVQGPSRSEALTAEALAALPQETLDVSFLAMGQPTQRREVGPALDAVLRAAGYRPDKVAWVAGVAGADGYTAVVTPAEDGVGGRNLNLALQETANGQPTTSTPRLVADGDRQGGRYVSNLTDLVVACVPLEPYFMYTEIGRASCT